MLDPDIAVTTERVLVHIAAWYGTIEIRHLGELSCMSFYLVEIIWKSRGGDLAI